MSVHFLSLIDFLVQTSHLKFHHARQKFTTAPNQQAGPRPPPPAALTMAAAVDGADADPVPHGTSMQLPQTVVPPDGHFL